VKAILAGAHAVQMVSALLRQGSGHLTGMVDNLAVWMERHSIGNISDMRGRVSLRTCVDPGNFERANYIRTLHRWGS
jgi:dihydroorotate dehydrogenase (fumarate)